ncbi:MAG TPA: adenylate/guanylate cyclase domain-containing protein [Vicinamibacterales bacterium]
MSPPASQTRHARRMRIRLRVGLGAAVSALVTVTLGAVSWVTFVNTRSAIVKQTNERVDAVLREVAQRVDSHLSTAVPAVEFARTLLRDSLVSGSPDALARQFALALRSHPSFSWMSYSDEAGTFTGAYRSPQGSLNVSLSTYDAAHSELRDYSVADDGRWTTVDRQSDYGYDPRTDRFYVAAREARSRVWVGPYVFYDEGVPGITCASPLYDARGRLRGVFTVDFNLNVLSQFVAALPFGEHGRVFILTRDGTVVAHPTVRLVQVTGEKARGKLITVATAGDPLMREWFDAWKRGGTETSTTRQFAFEYGGERYMAGGREVLVDHGVTWVIGAVAPESDFLGLLERNRRAALAILVASLVFGIVASLVLARRLAKPLITLAKEMEQVGNFVLADRPEQRTMFREVALMDESLLRMKGGLRSFSYYVPTDLVRAMLASGQEARLEGHTRNLTVFFSDIEGFTSVAETMTPDQLVEHLSRYLDEMTRIVAAAGGTIDKFIGDAIMAFWGAPMARADHAALACVAAVRCQRALASLRAAPPTPWLARLHARIGIASGDVLVGNVGTPERFNYTVMGDTVNLASRLEGLNKQYETSILVSESSFLPARDHVIGRLADVVQVKGRHTGVRVYELLGLVEDGDQQALEVATLWDDAFAGYLARDFESALTLFARVRGLRPADALTTILESRCRAYLVAPPPADWTGVHVSTEK